MKNKKNLFSIKIIMLIEKIQGIKKYEKVNIDRTLFHLLRSRTNRRNFSEGFLPRSLHIKCIVDFFSINKYFKVFRFSTLQKFKKIITNTKLLMNYKNIIRLNIIYIIQNKSHLRHHDDSQHQFHLLILCHYQNYR